MENALTAEGKALYQRKASKEGKGLCMSPGKQLYTFPSSGGERAGKGKKSHSDGSNSEATEH